MAVEVSFRHLTGLFEGFLCILFNWACYYLSHLLSQCSLPRFVAYARSLSIPRVVQAGAAGAASTEVGLLGAVPGVVPRIRGAHPVLAPVVMLGGPVSVATSVEAVLATRLPPCRALPRRPRSPRS